MGHWQGAAIIFDLDGVLIDADAVYERHWKRWAERHGVAFENVLAVHHGRPAFQTVEAVAPHLDAAAEADSYNRGLLADPDLSGVVAYPGAHDLVASLPEDRWAIATSATRDIATARLSYLELPEPGVFVTADDVARGKPEPDPYLLAATRLGFEPRRCVVIEDAPAGIAAARAAGAFVVAVTTTTSPDRLDAADGIIAALGDLAVTWDASLLRVSFD